MNVATFLLNEPVLMSEVNENAGRQTILQNQFLKESKQSIVPLLKPMRSCQSTFGNVCLSEILILFTYYPQFLLE